MRKVLRSRALQASIWIIIILGIIAGITVYWHHQSLYPSTDDAYVQANIVNVSAQIDGPVEGIFVNNYQNVKKGQLLFTLDPRPFQIAVEQAEAKYNLAEQNMQADHDDVLVAEHTVNSAKAERILAQRNASRILKLVKDGQESRQEGDIVNNKLSVAQANLEAAEGRLAEAKANLGQYGDENAAIKQAKAALDQAKLDLSYTKVAAPEAGHLVNFNLRPGNMVSANQSLFNIVETNEWWVNANFKETQLDRIRAGQPASIVLDIYPHHTYHGTVYRTSPGSGAAFSILPAENATGNWVKVTQRFTVKVLITDKPDIRYPLRVGASATVTVDTTHTNPA